MNHEASIAGPGQTSMRRCLGCGELLAPDDGERCVLCRPRLSKIAQMAEAATRRRQAEITAMEHAAGQLEITIRQVERVLKWRQRQARRRY
jgi:hypothetical protein